MTQVQVDQALLQKLDALPISQKLHVIDKLWEDIEASDEPLPISAEVLGVAKRRLVEMESDPSLCLTSEELWQRVDEARGK
ncbi:addiction module protein [Bythopirellula goksoeyrii]|uniref:Addiction module component n=1 Tax=Bythopirellula goksoeyrii TaxID=1400387 RepID=A0A5B9QC58_9BACT|nr:addiction module protein [Bythopirellula goksoeyrii]QEG35369.1 Putative addiction module component [Bythopirellula goksoeyrii]